MQQQAEHMTGSPEIGLDPSRLPIKEIALAIAERADQLGLVWRLVPATVANPAPGGVMRVVLDGDTVPIDAVTMIGRLPVGGRVFVILSPPAGVHIVGFLGYDFPPSVSGEAVGRSRLLTLASDFNINAQVTDVPTMLFTAAPNAGYIIQCRFSMVAQNADDCAVNWTVPSGAAMDRYYITLPIDQTAVVGDRVTMNRVAAGTATQSAGIPGAAPSYFEDTYLRTAATGGTVQLRFGRVAAAGSTATMRSNSFFTVQRYR